MELVLGIAILCVTALLGLTLHHRHRERTEILAEDVELRLDLLAKRVAAAEDRVQASFDPKAFAELKSQVDGLRIRAGIKG
jgi:hypothetical protein